jgi:hypothetical protein
MGMTAKDGHYDEMGKKYPLRPDAKGGKRASGVGLRWEPYPTAKFLQDKRS